MKAIVKYLEGNDYSKGIRAGALINVSKPRQDMDGDIFFDTILPSGERWGMYQEQLEFI